MTYYVFSPVFVSGTTVKAAPINTQFSAIQTGFNNVRTATNSALKVAGYSATAAITATPSSFLQLNASGVPFASQTLGFSPNMGAYRVQNVGLATVGTDAPNYGQMTAYIAGIAFGSPNVLTVPAFAGKSLQQLRLNTGETALEFAAVLPAVTVSQADSLITQDGQWVRSAPGRNLIPYSSLAWGARGWDVNPAWSIGMSKGVIRGYVGYTTSGTIDLIVTKVGFRAAASAGDVFTASADFASDASSGGRLIIRFYGSDNLQNGADADVSISEFTDMVFRRFKLTATAPAGTFYVGMGLRSRTYSANLSSYGSHFKLEAGTVATPWEDSATEVLLKDYTNHISHTRAAISDVVAASFGEHFGPTEINFKSSTNSYSLYSARIYAPVSGSGTGDGSIIVDCKQITLGKLAGYATFNDCGNTGAALTVNLPANGAKQKATVTNNTTITLTPPAATIFVDGIHLFFKNNATGGYTTTFASAATINWRGLSAPVMPTAANAEMEVFLTWDMTRFVGSWSVI